MTDIVERLTIRSRQSWSEVEDTLLLKEAADEIARLRRDVIQLNGICDRGDVYIKGLSEYIVQLEAYIVYLERVNKTLEWK